MHRQFFSVVDFLDSIFRSRSSHKLIHGSVKAAEGSGSHPRISQGSGRQRKAAQGSGRQRKAAQGSGRQRKAACLTGDSEERKKDGSPNPGLVTGRRNVQT